MKWSNKDKEMAVRHMSPGAKLGIFLFILVSVGVIGFVGWKYVSANLLSTASTLPEQVTAGETFEPGAVVDIYDTETEAVLDGVTQKIKAENPTDEWKEALEKVDCNDKNVCTALAPASGTSEDGGEGKGGFLNTGWPLASILGIGLLMWAAYFIINEETG